MIKVLHLLTGGSTGGIERLCVDIGKYSLLDNTFVFVTDEGILYNQMKDDGYKVISLKSNHKISLTKLNKLKNIAKEYDVVIVHHGDPILRMYYNHIVKSINIKGICVNHSCFNDVSQITYKGLKLKINDYIFQKCFDVSSRVWSVSKAGEISAKQRYEIDDSKCKVIYNGISPNILDKSRNHKISLKEPINITYIGRLHKIKGVDLLLDSINLLKNKYDLRLNIVGDGPLKEELINKVNNYNISNIVTFHGEQVDIDKYLNNTDIFVYPSICEEVFGISIVEAMSYSIPTIANKVGGIPEIIENKVNGYLTKDKTSKDIAELIELIINNKDINDVCKKARQTAEHFSILNTCKNIEEDIKGLL